ncbi:Ribosomal-protein-alanine acetyltransferase [Alloalcanivorax dieselolei B5]|uniref:[Ribosomal protein bS18]-alanine N-acetyltransferase n=1 Tax=Alcanivorax dieselolei (strain DSM 16502 / CGMCC 1.3690 / MCCC 1A00001 / B-5) TaxID=930169 RepID=K0CDM8_ALCDB|nr:ribosomal protein S18-alanine N-acetyltransferase [Alloalcanivorax dieselolei]AFT71709.1 Ribosomal-protein-alanine acetyltransferase [Alloalcanivorax dieselolei B5]GGJ88625.1 ribosomal-protein-alanine acetyltransferase [Alloalcanivorax dieselolei]
MAEITDDVRLRTMTSADLERVLAVEQDCQLTPWSMTNFRSCLASGYHCKVATHEGEITGFMVLSTVLDEAHLLNIAVAPAWQRRGIARWMLEQAIARAVDGGMSVMYLEVRAGNRGARKLYKQLGFEICGRRPGYYRAEEGYEDAVLMTLML